jgi:hypothetical protein
VSPRAEREAAMDEVSDYAQRFAPIVSSIPDPRPPTTLVPAHLITAMSPRRNIVAEFSALPVDQLLAEAEHALTRLQSAGRPTDYAVMVALVRQLARKPVSLHGALWIPEMTA